MPPILIAMKYMNYKVKCGGEEEEQPGNQGADSNRLVPHGCGEEFGSVQVDDEEGDGSPKLAQERQAQLRKEE